jgi:TatA/E family protein of Tat protein translocase
MFGFGGISEIAFILFLALLIFGPEKLPEIGRMLAKGMAEVRKASNELRRTLNVELAASEQEAAARRLAAQQPTAPAPLTPLASQAVPSAYPYSYALPPPEEPAPPAAAVESPDPKVEAEAPQAGAGADAPAAPAGIAVPAVTVLEPYGQGGGPLSEPAEIEAPR